MTIMTDYAVFYGIYDNPGERFFLMGGQPVVKDSRPGYDWLGN